MTDNKAVREAFEKEWPNWDKYPSGNYMDEIVQTAWENFQAGYAAALDRIEAVEAVTDEIVERFFSLYIDEWNDRLVFRNEYQIGLTSDTKRYERDRVRKVLKEVLK